MLLLKMGQRQEAADEIRTALKLDPNSPQIRAIAERSSARRGPLMTLRGNDAHGGPVRCAPAHSLPDLIGGPGNRGADGFPLSRE